MHQDRFSNPRDCEGNICTFLDETAKNGISHRIYRRLLDRSSPDFQYSYMYMDYKTDISYACILRDIAVVTD